MAAFVGFIVHANDIRFPWSQGYTVDTGLAPQALWDSIPEIAKWQIILTISFFEFWRKQHAPAETAAAAGAAAAHTEAAAKSSRAPCAEDRRYAIRRCCSSRRGLLLPELAPSTPTR